MHARLVLFLAGALVLAFATGAAAKTPLAGLRSPSGNIRCLFVPSARDDSGSHRTPNVLLCSLARSDYGQALQDRCMGPSGEGVDWHGFSLTGAGKGQIVCSGGILYSPDTQRPTYPLLAYGHSRRLGPFTCLSQRAGVTCRNRKGHGLFLARESWRAW